MGTNINLFNDRIIKAFAVGFCVRRFFMRFPQKKGSYKNRIRNKNDPTPMLSAYLFAYIEFLKAAYIDFLCLIEYNINIPDNETRCNPERIDK